MYMTFFIPTFWDMFTNYYKPINKLQGDFNMVPAKGRNMCTFSLFDTEEISANREPEDIIETGHTDVKVKHTREQMCLINLEAFYETSDKPLTMTVVGRGLEKSEVGW